jgi:hypothetical protein
MAQITKTYKSHKDFERHSKVMARQGWRTVTAATSTQQGGVKVARTAAKTVMTGGLGLLLTGRSGQRN